MLKPRGLRWPFGAGFFRNDKNMAFISDENDMEKLTAAITIKVTPDHLAIIERLAINDGVTVSDWMSSASVQRINEMHEQHLSLASIFSGAVRSDNH